MTRGRVALLVLGLLWLTQTAAWAAVPDDASGETLMQAVYDRHQQNPYVFEAQSLVLVDRHGQRNTRRLKRYSRVQEDGTVRLLLLFEAPREVRGVALLATREATGETRQTFYLPALGPGMIETVDASGDGHFLGSDFTVEDLTGEILEDYRYVRRRDERINGTTYYRVDVHPRAGDLEQGTPLRRHYILQDLLFIARTDHVDGHGEVARRQTHHDLTPVGGGIWRPNVTRMENLRDGHQSLLRIDRRVFSSDHVPEVVFSRNWILANQPARLPDLLPEESDPVTTEVEPDSGQEDRS